MREDLLKGLTDEQIAKAKACKSSDELLKLSDQMILEWKGKYEETYKQLLSVQAESDALKKKKSDGEPVLFRGKETDFYRDEVLDVVRLALEKAKPFAVGRAKDVIIDLLESNPSSGEREQLIDKLSRTILVDEINEPCLAELKRLGFTVENGGKHLRLHWHGDTRYHFTMSKTPSDSNATHNIERQIIKELFPKFV